MEKFSSPENQESAPSQQTIKNLCEVVSELAKDGEQMEAKTGAGKDVIRAAQYRLEEGVDVYAQDYLYGELEEDEKIYKASVLILIDAALAGLKYDTEREYLVKEDPQTKELFLEKSESRQDRELLEKGDLTKIERLLAIFSFEKEKPITEKEVRGLIELLKRLSPKDKVE